MGNRWTKVAGFLLLTMMIVAVWRMFTAPLVGSPEESLRVSHPAGFSIIAPKGWTADTKFRTPAPGTHNLLRIWREEAAGRPQYLTVAQFDEEPESLKGAQPGTFQGRPATVFEGMNRKDWFIENKFQVGPHWYIVSLRQPVPLPPGGGEFQPYFESFKTDPGAIATTTAPATSTAE